MVADTLCYQSELHFYGLFMHNPLCLCSHMQEVVIGPVTELYKIYNHTLMLHTCFLLYDYSMYELFIKAAGTGLQLIVSLLPWKTVSSAHEFICVQDVKIGGCGSAPCCGKVTGSVPLVCMSNCLRARYWTPTWQQHHHQCMMDAWITVPRFGQKAPALMSM